MSRIEAMTVIGGFGLLLTALVAAHELPFWIALPILLFVAVPLHVEQAARGRKVRRARRESGGKTG